MANTEYYWNKVKEALQLAGIFILLRLVMVDTGFTFINIPHVDNNLTVVLNWTKELFKGLPRHHPNKR